MSYGNHFGASGTSLQGAMKGAGLTAIPGLNSGKLIGYGTMTATIDIRTATRDSSETSFLQMGAQDSSSLKIYPNTLVKRVTFDGQKRATGVDVQANLANVKLDFQLSARKEVILSAGVWHSPQILMVSGVGPSATLSKYGIEVVSDLSGVGQNEWVSSELPTESVPRGEKHSPYCRTRHWFPFCSRPMSRQTRRSRLVIRPWLRLPSRIISTINLGLSLATEPASLLVKQINSFPQRVSLGLTRLRL